MSNKLPPLPVGVAPGSGYWNDWYEKLRTIVNNLISGIAHNLLTGLQGGQSGEYYHLKQSDYNTIVNNSWVTVPITTDTTVTSTSPTNVFSFVPLANKTYEVEGQLMLAIDNAAKGPQPGIAWNSGNDSGVAFIETTESSTTTVLANLTNGTDGVAAATSFPDATNEYPAQIKASFKTGATPSGSFAITLQSS